MKISSKPMFVVGIIFMLMGSVFVSGAADDVFIGFFALVGIDTTPPTFGAGTTPHSNGYVDISFISDKIWVAYVTDGGSGVQSVTYTDSYLTMAPLLDPIIVLSNVGDHWESHWINEPLISYSAGSTYNYEFTAVDGAGNVATKTGVFTIAYTNLAGVWSIKDSNDVGWTVISDPSQTYWFNDATLSFRFEKSNGAPDGDIICTLVGDYDATLSYSSGVWTHTQTFGDGTYSITMTARDSQGHVVQLSIYDLTIGGEQIPAEVINVLVGAPLLILGFLAAAMSIKKN